jgi:hypothetical protein
MVNDAWSSTLPRPTLNPSINPPDKLVALFGSVRWGIAGTADLTTIWSTLLDGINGENDLPHLFAFDELPAKL